MFRFDNRNPDYVFHGIGGGQWNGKFGCKINLLISIILLILIEKLYLSIINETVSPLLKFVYLIIGSMFN